MNVIIQTRGFHPNNVQYNEETEAYIRKKMEKITRLSKRLKDESSEIRVEVVHDDTKSLDESIKSTITLFIPTDTLRAEARAVSVQKSIDDAKQKLITQIEKYKGKFKKNDKNRVKCVSKI